MACSAVRVRVAVATNRIIGGDCHPIGCLTSLACDGVLQSSPLYVWTLAQNVARPLTESGQPTPDALAPRPRIHLPYHSPFYRTARLLGLAGMIGSALGVLGAVAGMHLNLLSLMVALLLSLGLIAYSVRPSLRRPKF